VPAEGYLRAVLIDGATPFHHRGRVRELLGLPPVDAFDFTPATPQLAFGYLHGSRRVGRYPEWPDEWGEPSSLEAAAPGWDSPPHTPAGGRTLPPWQSGLEAHAVSVDGPPASVQPAVAVSELTLPGLPGRPGPLRRPPGAGSLAPDGLPVPAGNPSAQVGIGARGRADHGGGSDDPPADAGGAASAGLPGGVGGRLAEGPPGADGAKPVGALGGGARDVVATGGSGLGGGADGPLVEGPRGAGAPRADAGSGGLAGTGAAGTAGLPGGGGRVDGRLPGAEAAGVMAPETPRDGRGAVIGLTPNTTVRSAATGVDDPPPGVRGAGSAEPANGLPGAGSSGPAGGSRHGAAESPAGQVEIVDIPGAGGLPAAYGRGVVSVAGRGPDQDPADVWPGGGRSNRRVAPPVEVRLPEPQVVVVQEAPRTVAFWERRHLRHLRVGILR
jgi:hypothetical protein